MGDAFDEDDDRLMIDDAMADSAAAANSSRAAPLAVPVSAAEKPLASAYECPEDGTIRGMESAKEEGEIDDEEECGGGAHSSHAFSGSSSLFQKATSWSGTQRNAGFYAALNGGGNYGYPGGLQQDRCAAQAAVASCAQASFPSPSTPKKLSDASSAPSQLAGEVCTSGAPPVAAQMKIPADGQEGARFGCVSGALATSPKVKRVTDDDTEHALRVSSGTDNLSEEFGTSSDPSTSVMCTNNRQRKKKRRLSGDDDSEELRACVPSSNASLLAPPNAQPASSIAEFIAKRKKQSMRDKSTGVNTRAVQTTDEDTDVRVGVNYCLDFCVLRKVSNYLYIVTNFNGRELYGILGDGLPPMDHAYMNKRLGGGLNAAEENGFDASSGSSNDRSNGSPSKQRTVHKRTNRSSSVCPANGVPEKSAAKKGLALSVGRPASASTSELHSVGASEAAVEEEMSQSPVWWQGDSVFAGGSGCCGTSGASVLLKETSSLALMTCPVAGCGFRFDTLAQLTCHRQSHFDRPDARAICVESMGTQTSEVTREARLRDFATSTEDLKWGKPPVAMVSAETQTVDVVAHLQTADGGPSSSQVADSKLTSTEKQSISELFQVVGADVSGCNRSTMTVKEEPVDSKLTVKGFENAFQGVSSRPLDAMEKLVGEGLHANIGDPPTSALFGGGVSHGHVPSIISSGGMMFPSTRSPLLLRRAAMSSTGGNSHTAAASPAFSDISDDAPTLEKEVAFKAEERALEHVKMLSGVSAPGSLGPLSLSVSGEKLCSVPPGGSDLAPSALQCTSASHSAAPVPSVSSARLPTEVVSTAVSSAPISNESGKKGELRPGPSVSSLNPFPAVTTLAGLEAAAFSSGMRPAPVGLHPAAPNPVSNASSAMLYNQPYMMSFAMPSPMPSGNTSSALGPSKHKIHDLKSTPSGISGAQKDSSLVRVSPSMVASPGSRPLSGGPSGTCQLVAGASAACKPPSNSQTVGGGAGASGQRPPSCTAPFMGQPPTMSQIPADRSCAAAISIMQQQQQQAQFMAQLQQQQHMQLMQSQFRFGGNFPMAGGPSSAAVVAHAAYEQQLAAMQAASLGIFGPTPYPPK